MVGLILMLCIYWGITGYIGLKLLKRIDTNIIFSIFLVISFSLTLFFIFGLGLPSLISVKLDPDLANPMIQNVIGVIWWCTLIFSPLVSIRILIEIHRKAESLE